MQLYGYWRSGATWRVRLALALKGFNYGKEVEYTPVHLVKEGGEQKSAAYTKLNPAQVSKNLSWRVDDTRPGAAPNLLSNYPVVPIACAYPDYQGQKRNKEAHIAVRVPAHL